MNILEFINSKDVADYLRETNYKFSPMEQAYLVHQSQNHTLEQKKRAWMEIAEMYPDEIYDREKSGIERQPLAQVLKKYIAYIDRLVALCKEPARAVWEFSYLIEGESEWEHRLLLDNIPYYSSFEGCFKSGCNALFGCAPNHTSAYGTVKKFCITKTFLDECDQFIALTFNAQREILTAEGMLDSMWYDLFDDEDDPSIAFLFISI